MNATATTTRTLQLGNGLEITIDERGDAAGAAGSGVLLLHSGAGPQSIAGLAAALSEHAYVVTPTHPGFNGTPRVPWLDSVADLADAYLDLLDALGLHSVMVIGNSVGGWIASEMALRDIHGRLSALVLLNANGIRPDGVGQVTDIRGMPPAAIGKLSFFSPAFRPDPATMTPEQLAGMAANQQALAVYAGEDFMFAPKLRRLAAPRHRARARRLGRGGRHRPARLRPRLRRRLRQQPVHADPRGRALPADRAARRGARRHRGVRGHRGQA